MDKKQTLLFASMLILLLSSVFLNLMQGDRIEELTDEVLQLRHAQDNMDLYIKSLEAHESPYGE